MQALQYKAVLEGIWRKLCCTSVEGEVPGLLCEVKCGVCRVECEK